MDISLDVEVGPKYQQLKSYVLKQIEEGEWLPSHHLPSENEFVQKLNVSRMTVNRALRELASEGYLKRVPGVGTFVAEFQSRSHFMEIHNIADEVQERKHSYSARIIINKREKINSEVAKSLQLRENSNAFHSIIVHLENQVPIQVEDRFVNAKIVPEYGKVDFTQTTPSEFLLKAAPLQEVEHTVQARMASTEINRLLKMEKNEPCLILLRRTWSQGIIVSYTTLYHPGNRYELSDHFRA